VWIQVKLGVPYDDLIEHSTPPETFRVRFKASSIVLTGVCIQAIAGTCKLVSYCSFTNFCSSAEFRCVLALLLEYTRDIKNWN
jgi:hypothetical protein